SAAPAWRGQTRLVLTPLGAVSAATHRAPVALTLELRQVSLEKLWQLTAAPPPRRALESDFARAARRSLSDFAARQILLGALAAWIVPLGLRLRRPAIWAAAPVIGGATVAVALAATYSSFNWQA